MGVRSMEHPPTIGHLLDPSRHRAVGCDIAATHHDIHAAAS
jgi:hypothetical protein